MSVFTRPSKRQRSDVVGRVWPDYDSISFLQPRSSPPVPGAPVGYMYYDDGTNRCNPLGLPGPKFSDGTSWCDLVGQTCGQRIGFDSLTLSDGVFGFTMNAATGYRWIQQGPLLTIQAYLQWNNKGSATGTVRIANFLPVPTVGDPPQFQSGLVGSHSGLVLPATQNDPHVRVPVGSRDLFFVKSFKQTGVAMQFMTAATDFATGGGIMYLSGTFIVGTRALGPT